MKKSLKLSSVEQAYRAYLAWRNPAAAMGEPPQAPNGDAPGSPEVGRIKASVALKRAKEILANTPESLEFGRVEDLPKRGTVWVVDFPNLLRGGSITFLDPRTGAVVLSLKIIEG